MTHSPCWFLLLMILHQIVEQCEQEALDSEEMAIQDN